MKQNVALQLNEIFRLKDFEDRSIVDQGEVHVTYAMDADDIGDDDIASRAQFTCRTPKFAADIIRRAADPENFYRHDENLPVLFFEPVDPAHDGGFNSFPEGKLKIIFTSHSGPSRLSIGVRKDASASFAARWFSALGDLEDEEEGDDYKSVPEEGPTLELFTDYLETLECWGDLDWTAFVPYAGQPN